LEEAVLLLDLGRLLLSSNSSGIELPPKRGELRRDVVEPRAGPPAPDNLRGHAAAIRGRLL
jgi:hypothetical protein